MLPIGCHYPQNPLKQRINNVSLYKPKPIKMSNYYKSKRGSLIIKLGKMDDGGDFCGTVVFSNSLGYKIGDKNNYYHGQEFTPYTPTPQELVDWGETDTLTNDNPNKVEVDDKDVNLRLECLKLALQENIVDPLSRAKRFYDWITTNLIAKP